MKSLLNKAGRWIILLFVADVFFMFIIWLVRPQYFAAVAPVMLLFTLLFIGSGIFLDKKHREKERAAMRAFLNEQSEKNLNILLETTDISYFEIIHEFAAELKRLESALSDEKEQLSAYRDFIEECVHELKTPLSLSLLVLENHRDEMSDYVYSRMDYIRRRISGNAERILYYARLHSSHADYKFELLRLDLCVKEALAEFSAEEKERGIKLCLEIEPLKAFCDRRILLFMLSQLLNNAFKYADREKGLVKVALWQASDGEREIHLAVRDNGRGILPQDAPFIFDKGFTGEAPERHKATGMGLYFVKRYAELMSLELRIEKDRSSGFGIELIFPCALDK